MVQGSERQPPNQLRLFGGYGPSERLRLLVGHALIYLNIYALTTRSTTQHYHTLLQHMRSCDKGNEWSGRGESGGAVTRTTK